MAFGCEQHEKCSGKCQNKFIANIPRSSNTSRSFPYYGQGKHSLAVFTGMVFDGLKDCQVSTLSTLQGTAMYHPGTLPGFTKSRDRGKGQEKCPFSRTLGPPVGIFHPQFQHPSVSPPFTAQYLLKDAPFHSSFPNTETAANSSLEQIKARNRNISQTCSRPSRPIYFS